MADSGSSLVLRHIRTLFGAGVAGDESDGQLLDRFRRLMCGPEADAAFAVLVERHGPMVLGVCRRTLRNPGDADDAFQATFLVLARKAGAVRVDDSLGRWLYGVSRRVASKARVQSARRAVRETSGSVPETASPEANDERSELFEALDEEVARLPEPFRTAIVLCDLGGLTHETAARQLGCPVGTVESRLSRGRKRLRERLVRRGFGPLAAGPLAVRLWVLPEALSVAAVKAAARVAPVSVTVAKLAEGVFRDMALNHMKNVAMAVGALSIACGLGVGIEHRLAARHKPAKLPERGVESPAKPDRIALQPPPKIKPGDILQIEVLEALPGRPITGSRFVRPDGTISLGFYGDLTVAGMTRYEIKVQVIEHLRKYLNDDTLGLVGLDIETTGVETTRAIAPADSDRVYVDESANYFRHETPAEPAKNLDNPTKVNPGDVLLINVNASEIDGQRPVHRDGTIVLGKYGNLPVAGLTRDEIKIKVIERLRRSMSDEQLGLVRSDPGSGQKIAVAPADSALVSVDVAGRMPQTGVQSENLTAVLEAIEAMNFGRIDPGPVLGMTRRLANHENRLGELEAKLDRLIQAIEGLNRGDRR